MIVFISNKINKVRKKAFRRTTNKRIHDSKIKRNRGCFKGRRLNHVTDNNTPEGKLIVTNQIIYFKTLDTETQKKFNLKILFGNILEVILYSKGLLFGVKGLNVVTSDSKSHAFPLKKRDR